MFELYQKTVNINGQEYVIKPLLGGHLAKLFPLIKKFRNITDKSTPEELMELLDKEAILDIHYLCSETMKTSYPDKDPKEIELWVSQNLFYLFNVVIDVNLHGR